MTRILYYLVFSLVWLISLIPYWVLYRISDVLYVVIYYIAGYRKSTVYKNIRTAFPEKSEQEVDLIVRKFYRHFSDFLVEISKTIRISRKVFDKRMKHVNPEIFQELASRNRNFALVSAHYNNWEMMINIPNKMPHDFLVIYRPLRSGLSDRLSKYMRSRCGAILHPMESIFREALKRKTENKMFGIWFLADQRPPRNSKFWTLFLNHEAAFFEGMEKISKKLDLAVVFMDIQKIKRGYYQVRYELLYESTENLPDNEIMLTCIKKMEEEIRQKPEFWLWSHKRFKHIRPDSAKLIAS